MRGLHQVRTFCCRVEDRPAEPVAAARPIGYITANAPVAQLDRALPSEGKGHTFESCRVRQLLFVLQRDMQTQRET